MLNRITSVQECDARKAKSIDDAGYIKKIKLLLRSFLPEEKPERHAGEFEMFT
jgi:hypothetical protein